MQQGTIEKLQAKARDVIASSIALQRACEYEIPKKDVYANVKAEVFELRSFLFFLSILSLKRIIFFSFSSSSKQSVEE